VTIALAAVVLGGCQTGERPSFEDDGNGAAGAAIISTGSSDIDLVLDRLESVEEATFAAEYDIETKFGSLSSTGTVVQTDDDVRSVTVATPSATTRFLSTPEGDETCNLLTDECESVLNDARISDVGIPHTFYGPSFATRLRVSADRRIGESASYTKPIAGQDARCVDVAVAGGTETFCALDSGLLAEFVGADVTIELTSYSPDADAANLTP
jgi:hypothetical protein